jgi:outer membrane lipoprotein carrier protein
MKYLLVLSVFIFLGFNAQAQDKAAQAKLILDKLSAKTKKYTNLNSVFSFVIVNKAKKTNEKHEGSIWVKGEKYKLELSGQTIISDGKTVWTYIKEANEVQINNADKKEDDGKITPRNIFTMYEKGFKYEFVKEELKNKIQTQIIKLFPLEPKKKNYHTAEIFIDKIKNEIVNLIVNGKDGTTSTYSVKKLDTKTVIAEDTFVFNKTKYPTAEIVDLRD